MVLTSAEIMQALQFYPLIRALIEDSEETSDWPVTGLVVGANSADLQSQRHWIKQACKGLKIVGAWQYDDERDRIMIWPRGRLADVEHAVEIVFQTV